jgi:hypothetical protein
VAWWAQILDDFQPAGENTADEAELRGPAGRWLIFLKVPEPKTVKNRMHICLRPVDRSRDEEIDRVLGLGATMVNDLRDGDTGWAVLADSGGNEFCVLRGRADEAGIDLKCPPRDGRLQAWPQPGGGPLGKRPASIRRVRRLATSLVVDGGLGLRDVARVLHNNDETLPTGSALCAGSGDAG